MIQNPKNHVLTSNSTIMSKNRRPRSSPTQRVKNPNATGANNRSNNKNNNQNNRKVVTQRVSAQRYPPARPPKNNNVSRNNANSGLSTSTTTLQRNSLKIPMTLIAWASSPQCEAHLNNINNTVGVEVSLALFFFYFSSLQRLKSLNIFFLFVLHNSPRTVPVVLLLLLLHALSRSPLYPLDTPIAPSSVYLCVAVVHTMRNF